MRHILTILIPQKPRIARLSIAKSALRYHEAHIERGNAGNFRPVDA
jgi:hypothetical protein